ncbi:hypothetical protein LPJ56_001933 [Coemansia sp. RSA 2599]|nr:hypothetical protein LPJ75_001559 [Coemansia sp. RSA 2598]KAJ1826935.1 hypothetical protein LPJ56_001933 [Coemansia sp. RSA 2599]
MSGDKGQSEHPERSKRALEKATDTTPSNGEAPGLMSRIVDSASKLASSVSHSATSGPSAFDPNLLSEQKAGGQQGSSSSISREWVAENRSANHTGLSERAADTDRPILAAGPSSSASAFRQAIRASNTHGPLLPSGVVKTPADSHQVQLAQNIDGRGVVDFLSHSMPTSMSTVVPGQGATMPLWQPARQMGPQVANTIETTDPIAYLQGTTYAADMEMSDHQVPSSSQNPAAAVAGNSGSLHSSPSGLIKSWNEHGASILEEWELNEAWDRAWMDTAWQTARKSQKDPEEEVPKPEPVVPSSRNLSNLLKPRI